jgi:hypothetical protein
MLTAMRTPLILALLCAAGCAYSPTGPTQMALTINQSNLPVGGTAIVTATLLGSDGTVSFSSSLGTFAPSETHTVRGVATSTFTATRSGIGTIGALSGSVAAEPLQVRIGEFPALPEITTTPPAPTVFLSCQSGTAGVPTICAVSGSSLQAIAVNWGDGSPEQSLSPTITSMAHVFTVAGNYAVSVRGVNGSGQAATATATATIVAPPPPPPVVTTPGVTTTSVFMSQEADAGAAGCAAFTVSATAATGTRITSIIVNKVGGSQVARFDFTSSGRFAVCDLNDDTDILSVTATDSDGFQATYQLIVR